VIGTGVVSNLPNPSLITEPAKTAEMIRIMKCGLVAGQHCKMPREIRSENINLEYAAEKDGK
jgi:hypothetical protein